MRWSSAVVSSFPYFSCVGILRSMILRQLAPHRLMQQPQLMVRMPEVPLEEEEGATAAPGGMREVGSFQVRDNGSGQDEEAWCSVCMRQKLLLFRL
jgi:hypothetical protein